MGTEGLKAAALHALTLPAFGSLTEAQVALTAKKSLAIAQLLSAAASSHATNLDFSAESLLRLEQWYFERIDRRRVFGLLRRAEPEELAESCAFYFGEVVVRTISGVQWVVEEFAFAPGRYEIGIRKGLGAWMLSSFHSTLHHKLNRTHDSMWRTYHHYFVPGSGIQITF